MRRWTVLCAGLIVVAVAALPCPAPACSLCDGSLKSQTTFRKEFEEANLVLYGTLANARLNDKKPGVAPGSGATDFDLVSVLKNHPGLGNRQQLELPRYIPILDPKNPPKYVIFCSVKDGQLNAYYGKPVTSDAVVPYLHSIIALKGKDRTQQLLHFFHHLDSKDATISHDAFLEFALCNDQEVGDIAKKLPAEPLRRLLQDPATPSERLSLYAFLLGAGGQDKNAAEFLRKMIEQPSERTANALDGLLCGYISLRPRDGWDLAATILADSKRPFKERFTVARALRFYHAWKPAQADKEVLRCLAVMLQDGEIADLAINDLREWKMWDLTREVLAGYGKESHDSPLVRRQIVRYALCCPQPEARQFVAKVRQQDAELVRELEENLEVEKGK